MERINARALADSALPFPPELVTIDVSFISIGKLLGPIAACAAPDLDLLALVKPQFELGPERVGKGVVRKAEDRRDAIRQVAAAAAGERLVVRGLASSGLPGPKGNRETFIWATRWGPGRSGGGPPGGRAVTRAMLITHTHPETTSGAVAATVEAAEAAGVQLVATADELEQGEAAAGIERVDDGERPDVCIVLGGDGSILYALRRFADTGVPVFGVNFGTIGFLAAVERDELQKGLPRAFSADFEVMDLPALRVDLPVERPVALNDVSFVRRPHSRSLSSPTGSAERRWEAFAATGFARPPRARPATTSPTPARSWRGA